MWKFASHLVGKLAGKIPPWTGTGLWAGEIVTRNRFVPQHSPDPVRAGDPDRRSGVTMSSEIVAETDDREDAGKSQHYGH